MSTSKIGCIIDLKELGQLEIDLKMVRIDAMARRDEINERVARNYFMALDTFFLGLSPEKQVDAFGDSIREVARYLAFTLPQLYSHLMTGEFKMFTAQLWEVVMHAFAFAQLADVNDVLDTVKIAREAMRDQPQPKYSVDPQILLLAKTQKVTDKTAGQPDAPFDLMLKQVYSTATIGLVMDMVFGVKEKLIKLDHEFLRQLRGNLK